MELRSSQIAERSGRAEFRLVFRPTFLLQAVTQRLAEIVELLAISVGAERNHNLLPIHNVCIVNNIPHVFTNHGSKQAEVVRTIMPLCEIRSLDFINALVPTADRKHECIRNPVFLQTHIDSPVIFSQDHSLRDGLVGFGFITSE